MLKKEEFISFILDGQAQALAPVSKPAKDQASASDLMSFGFDIPEVTQAPQESGASFAQRLLVASDYGLPEMVQTKQLIRGSDAVAKYLPERASFWPKTQTRPYQTLLFDADMSHKDLLAIPAFRSRKMSHLDIVEDALARMVSEALDGFQKGGEGVKADVRQGKSEETLCIVSVRDEREQQKGRLVCFGTVNAKSNGLETFHITEQTRYWEPQLAKDHLGLLYERQFKKLGTITWQDAFTTSEERKQAEKLLEVCSSKSPEKKEIEESIINLLDTIAKNFGLRCKTGQSRRLQAFNLPSDHDIGIDPEELTSKHAGKNPFDGVTLRDDKSRLLGYIVYPLKKKEEAAHLRRYLEKNNRFHNVLVVFPDGEETTVELWQGMEQLSGKLRKDHGFHGAAEVVSLLSRFFVVSKAKVRNPTELAQELAYRARYLRRLAIKELATEKSEGPLRDLYKAFKEALVHDQTENDFADAFAQTLTYGLLTSRWIGNNKLAANVERFTRQKALDYLPTTSNFLGDLFKTALSVKMDDQRGRLLWLVDDIADLLDRIDVTYVFGIGDQDSDQATDPVIHFYEPFLAAYDNELRNKRGVYFTPRPVVSFIVRSVHELLQTEFGLEDGLASIATWGDVQKKFPDLKIPNGVNSSDQFVCILDPATGTGTFLYECIEVIERTMKDKWCNELKKDAWDDPVIISRWRAYVPQYLLPRLYGYELMMASYSIAHLKLAFKLGETGYDINDIERLHIYLTNSLEPHSESQMVLPSVMPSIAIEAIEVNKVKHGKRFTVIIGNPPYSLISANMDAGHRALIERYKFIKNERIHERGALQLEKILNDDYVKFIAKSQECIDSSGIGIIGVITNHAYLDNPTMRGLRHSFISSYQCGYLYDLGGSAKKSIGETDENVFDIQQGVAIGIFINNDYAHKEEKIDYKYAKLSGTRDEKYNYLKNSCISTTSFFKLQIKQPFFLMVPTNYDLRSEYDDYVELSDIFILKSIGLFTSKDSLVIDSNEDNLLKKIKHFQTSKLSNDDLCDEVGITAKAAWNVTKSRDKLKSIKNIKKNIVKFLHRPFDAKFIFYERSLVWSMAWPVNKNLVDGNNIALTVSRQLAAPPWSHVFCSNSIVELCYITNKTKEGNHVFPLYRIEDELSEPLLHKVSSREHNFHINFLNIFSSRMGLTSVDSKLLNKKFSPSGIFNYIYAIFHSNIYRSRYIEFLKIDFPRVPLAERYDLFHSLAIIGDKLVNIHMLNGSLKLKNKISYVGNGDDSVLKKPIWKDDAIWINATQRFEGVPQNVWSFNIGCYQVCEKWLKDRKGRVLSSDDILHYQKVIIVISETIFLMAEIDTVIDAHGGWPGAFQSTAGGAK